jgi:hypothetical protein
MVTIMAARTGYIKVTMAVGTRYIVGRIYITVTMVADTTYIMVTIARDTKYTMTIMITDIPQNTMALNNHMEGFLTKAQVRNVVKKMCKCAFCTMHLIFGLNT